MRTFFIASKGHSFQVLVDSELNRDFQHCWIKDYTSPQVTLLSTCNKGLLLRQFILKATVFSMFRGNEEKYNLKD